MIKTGFLKWHFFETKCITVKQTNTICFEVPQYQTVAHFMYVSVILWHFLTNLKYL